MRETSATRPPVRSNNLGKSGRPARKPSLHFVPIVVFVSLLIDKVL
jgi:hypothetical protein